MNRIRIGFLGVAVAGVLAFGALAPAAASALSVDDIQSQINALLQQVKDLTKQLNELRAQHDVASSTPVATTPATTTPPQWRHRICDNLPPILDIGAQGDHVQNLQDFLHDQGFFSASSTGYFGSVTARAVTQWQSSWGISPAGVLGPVSRGRLQKWCGNGDTADTETNTCAKERRPVCGLKQVVCIKAPCNPVPQTYGNKCMMEADGAKFAYEGACHPEVKKCSPRPACLDNPLSMCNPMEPAGGWCPKKCTPRPACLDATPRCLPPEPIEGWCPTDNGTPVISSFSGPTTLKVNEQGTWSIEASDPENGTLSYRVTWGDDQPYAMPMMNALGADAFVQTTTFTHSYARAGTYTVIIVVRDQAGREAKTSTTVKVGTDSPVACTLEYAPVCGRPTGCSNPCPAGAYCAMLCRPYPVQAYSNKCFLKAAGAELVHEGLCTTTDADTNTSLTQ